MSGIKNENGKITCMACGAIVGKNNVAKLNFCPNCGEPLNIDAQVEFEKKVSKQHLLLLAELLEEMEQTTTDAKSIINKFMEELNENLDA